MKKLSLLLCALCVGLCMIACTPNGESIVNGSTDTTQYYSYEKGDEYAVGNFAQTIEEIDSIEINWLNGSVNIRGEDSLTVTAREDYLPKPGYEPYSLHYYVEKKVLHLRFMHCNLQISTSLPTKNLTVAVPKNFLFKKITVTTNTAKTNIRDLSCDDFAQYSGGIGTDFLAENCKFKSFFSDVTTGDTTVSSCSFAEKTEFTLGTGSFIMENSETALLKGTCRTGDLILKNARVLSADVSLSLTGDCYFTDLYAENFSVSCTAGDIFVHLSPDMTDYSLQCRSPFKVSYPENMPTEESKNVIHLKTATGKIKFLEKEEIEDLLLPPSKEE